MNKRMILTVFLAIFAVLVLPLFALAAPDLNQSPISIYLDESNPAGNYVVYVTQGGEWNEAGKLSFDKYFRSRALDLGRYVSGNEGVKIRLVQQGGGAAHIDAVTLGDSSPVEVKGIEEALALKKLSRKDFDVVDAFQKSIELSFPEGRAGTVMSLTARVEGTRLSGSPFQFPLSNVDKDITRSSEFYPYSLMAGKNGPRGNDRQDMSENPFFKEYSVTGSGHPSGYTYGWVRNDENNLYVTIDFTPDNTLDGDKDYSKVYVKTDEGVREFKVSVPETKWGKTEFIYTDKAAYQHKVYGFTIPLNEIGIRDVRKDEKLQLAFAAYGTAATPQASKNATGSYDGTYPWTITKDVDKTKVAQASGDATFNYTVNVGHGDREPGNVKVTGTITIHILDNCPTSSPTLNAPVNAVQITSVTDTLSDGTECTVIDGGEQSLLPGYHLFEYECSLGDSLPSGTLTNTATVSWPDQPLCGGPNTIYAGQYTSPPVKVSFVATEINRCVTVSDTYAAGPNQQVCVGDSNPKTFTYSETFSVPASGCETHNNTATVSAENTTIIDSAGQSVEVCKGGAQILYGIDRASNLYTVDYVNGSTHLIGPLGFPQASAFTINKANEDAFASPGGRENGVLPTTGCLYRLDLTTGAATQMGCDPDQKGLDPFSDFAMTSDGILYALRLACTAAPYDCGMYLCTIDQATGGITDIGKADSSWYWGYSLAFVSDTLYTWDGHWGLSTLDTTTAARTVIGWGEYIGFPIDSFTEKIPAMAARQDGTLYGIFANGTSSSGADDYFLATINKATGDMTYVATLPSGMQNLAFSGPVDDGCPWDDNKTEPGVCGCGVVDTDDTDGDGIPDCLDQCPLDPAKRFADVCGCGVAETDSDGDGTPDCIDLCPNDPGKTEPGVCGCGTSDADSDWDGILDCNDLCPYDPLKTAPGACACGVADTGDTDGDGTLDCFDGCPSDPNKITPGYCGCGAADTDTDGDGIPDCNDGCPLDPLKATPGVCGCGVADTDSDSDGTPNCNDLCPSDPLKTAPGACGCGIADTDANNNGIADCNDTLPDLTGSFTSLKFNAKNKTLSGRLSVANSGSLNAGTFTVSYYLSSDTTGPGTLIATDTLTGVRIGRAANSSLSYKSLTSLSGQYVIAVVDSGSQVTEINENNNRTAQLIP